MKEKEKKGEKGEEDTGWEVSGEDRKCRGRGRRRGTGKNRKESVNLRGNTVGSWEGMAERCLCNGMRGEKRGKTGRSVCEFEGKHSKVS